MSPRPLSLYAVVAAGCAFHQPAHDDAASDVDGRMRIDADPDLPDAPVDAAVDGAFDGVPDAELPDATPVCLTWTSQHVDPCALPPPTAPWHLTTGIYTYNTTSGTLSPGPSPLSASVAQLAPGAPPVRVISVDSFTMDTGAVLTVIGSSPLVIASWDTMSISGIIDAGSHLGGVTGAGAEPAGECGAATAGENGESTGGSGGGGGGGYRGKGGDGGQGDSPPGPLGGGGGAGLAAAPAYIRGGCRGAPSGTAGTGASSPSNPATVSARGAGGGAIHFTARTSITVMAGQVVAGGGGGGGAPQGSGCGGGGGGAGGYIGFDAPMVRLQGSELAANGGGGGASATFPGIGNPGADGGATPTAAPGGAAQVCAPAGGDGGAGASFGGDTATGNGACGGGGGGGATGFVIVWSPDFMTPSTTISPTVVTNP